MPFHEQHPCFTTTSQRMAEEFLNFCCVGVAGGFGRRRLKLLNPAALIESGRKPAVPQDHCRSCFKPA
jgi:hypothetical protein